MNITYNSVQELKLNCEFLIIKLLFYILWLDQITS